MEVRIAAGVQSASTASSRSVWPGSSGENSGTATLPGVGAAKKPITYSEACEGSGPGRRAGDLLQAGGHGTQSFTELGPGQVLRFAVTFPAGSR